MRAVIFLLTFILFGDANSDIINKIDQKIDQIEKMTQKKIPQSVQISYDPFYNKSLSKQLYTPESKSQIIQKKYNKLSLSSIFDKKAFINLKWYKENEKIYDYTIVKINKDSVFLKNKNKIIVLRLMPSARLLSIKEASK